MELAIEGTGSDRPARIPGNRGIWVGIFCELTEFALMFIVYGLFRFYHPEDFRNGPALLNTTAGVANTLLLLTSGYCAVRASLAMRRGRSRSCMGWLGLTLLGGIGFLVVKFFEIRWNMDHGVTTTGNSFVTMYYYMTVNHVVHVAWGCLGLLWALAQTAFGAYTATEHEGLEAATLYWHATDLAWIVIFPLAYVVH